MRSKNPELMEKISRYIGDYYRKAHRTPTVRAIADGVGLSKSAVYNYLREMNDRGIISYEDGVVADLPKIDKTETGFFSAPLVGSIRCGDPETEEEQVEMYISLPEALFGRGDFYLLRATGDSMVDAGITEGDLILIKKQPTCEIGDVVVALDQDGQNTLKIYGGIDEENGMAILEYANEEMYPGERILVSKLVVQGIAQHVIKKL